MMKKIKNLFQNKLVAAGSWYIITDLFLKGMQFLAIPIFTRILDPINYGMQSLFFTWASIFTIVCSLNLSSSITKAKFDFEEKFNEYISSITVLSFISFFVSSIVLLSFGRRFITKLGFSPEVFRLLLIYSFALSIINIVLVKYRVDYDYKKVSVINITISVIGILLSVLFIKNEIFNEAYFGKILGESLPKVIFSIFCLLLLLKKFRLNKTIDYWRYAISYSLPLVLHSISNVINNNFDRIVIEKYFGSYDLGLYSLAYSLGAALIVIVHALDSAWSPWVFNKIKLGEHEDIISNTRIYRNFIIFTFFTLLLFTPEIVKLMSGQEYWKSMDIIPWVLVGYFITFEYTLDVKIEFYYNKTFLTSVGTLLSALINIVLNIMFVPVYGYKAAAITTTVSYFFMFIFHYVAVKLILNKNIYSFQFHSVTLLLSIIGLLIFKFFKSHFFIRIIIWIIIILLILILTYKQIKKLKIN